MFDIVFFRQTNGRCPVIEFVEGLHGKHQDKIYAWIGLLEEKGNRLVRPHADYVREGIYELRIQHGKTGCRIFYFFDNKRIVLTNGYVKRSRKLDNASGGYGDEMQG